MDNQALGLIEVIGMTGAIEAADVCVKSANVQLIGYELSTGGLVTVKVQGNIGAVKSAIDAAKISASKISQVLATLIIPRPAEGIESMIKTKTSIPENEDSKDFCEIDEKQYINISDAKEMIAASDIVEKTFLKTDDATNDDDGEKKR
ncbi:BMC domain-containing protein [Clostridium formicaceticum]|uniref:Propanediol utilization protein PduA n=1 Tax=Clostridium formicaceticum TaxID=1497 RepID=A0AAC9WGC1_9CLOT|nr:BMC domain-containing protein [Clostridium formicaceticum]AOY77129.1 hypothetical protein BJL90_15505 [Clostridium formicaceticum]ARE87644.1 Propanediol utilization protein PduA [Clostridium formicaceticum]